MKNVLLMMSVTLCALVTLDSQLMAGGPSTGGGKDGGKTSSRARVVFNNTSTDVGDDIQVWVRPEGTALPATVRELEAMLVSVNVGEQNVRTGALANGTYTVTTFFASEVQSVIDSPLTQSLFDTGAFDEETVILNGEDQEFDIDGDAQLTAVE